MTHTERIAAAWALGLGLGAVVTWLFHWLVMAVWWWPLVGSEWRAERSARLDAEAVEAARQVYREITDIRPASMLQPVTFGDWDDEPITDDDADQMIATWHGTDEQEEQLADVHPIYLDLSDDPDLIVWDAKQQADRCWEIVHVEFPRLRAELAGMWDAAA